MHVKTKKLAVSGLLMALAVVLIVLSGVLDFNTLFFLAAAAFFIGIIVREFGLKYGAAFFIGCGLLGFVFAPQKLYCITYGMMGIYVLGVEFFWYFLGLHAQWKRKKLLLTAGKVLLFNLMYIPALLLFPKLLFAGDISRTMILVFILGGQLALFLFDRAYDYFLIQMWGQMRNKLFGKEN